MLKAGYSIVSSCLPRLFDCPLEISNTNSSAHTNERSRRAENRHLRRTTSPSTPNMSKKLAFVLDIDGCLSHEGIPISGSKEALHKLRANNIPFVVCTNGGGQLESTRAERLSKTFDINISPDQVILSHTPLRSEVVRLKDHRVLIVGEHCAEVARAYGLPKAEGIREYGRQHPSLFPRRREVDDPEVSDDADDPVKAVLFFEDPEDLGETLQLVLDVLLTNGNPSGPRVLLTDENAQQEVEVWFTNPDLVYSGLANHPRLTQGSYRMCLETLFRSVTSSTSTSYYSASKDSEAMHKRGRTLHATTCGKPTTLTGKTALDKLLRQCPQNTMEQDLEIWAVGDNPYSDVALANTMKWNGCLVRTGIWDGDESRLDSIAQPAKVIDSFGKLLKLLIPE